MWRTWMFGFFERNEYEVVVSSNRSMLHLGASELKVISMIYAPLYLMRRRNRRCSRSQAHNVSGRYPRKHTRRKHWKGNRRASIYYYKQSPANNIKKATRENTRYHIYRRERLVKF